MSAIKEEFKTNDSYQKFIDGLGINRKDFLDWGINNTIYPQDSEIEKFWEELKRKIDNREQISIRGYGRNGRGNEIITRFYSELGISIKIDPSNNMKPTQNLQKLTGLRKNIDIVNYQVSHIFGKTKNVYMFECPWNICFVPKIFDPLTGHEAKGDFPDKYKEEWISIIKEKYKSYINDYNGLMKSKKFKEKFENFVNNPEIINKYENSKLKEFKKDMLNEFSPIE